jgi:hypothetical protein
MPAGRRSCTSAKASGLPTKNRSARPELQKCIRTHPSERVGHPKKQTTMLAGRRSCRRKSGAAQGQKPQVCRPKTGRPDLSYKMLSDPPFRSDPSKLRARRVGHPKKQIPRPPIKESAADVADGGLGRTTDTNEHKTPGPRNNGGRPGLQRTDPHVQTTYGAPVKAKSRFVDRGAHLGGRRGCTVRTVGRDMAPRTIAAFSRAGNLCGQEAPARFG